MRTRDRRARARMEKRARLRSGARLLAAAALACMLTAGVAASLVATTAWAAPEHAPQSGAGTSSPKPGSGGWFWPTGTEDFGSYAGFLAPRGAYVHVAQDMRSPKGNPVYAIGAGTVWISRADAGGYGVDGATGGCMIIVHRTAAGEEFRALYGHVSGLQFKAGDRVTAGAVIATINGCAHLHFGIHPSAVYRDRNPYAGSVPKSWADHGGFVDPVEYLKANPRAATYVAPALPVVKITTQSAPSRYGATAGMAYWDEPADGAQVTYAYDLLGGTRRALAAGETAPPFDEVRYGVQPLAAPALGISVRDRQPVLAAEARPAAPAWGAPARLSATLTNSAAKPFEGARIALERLTGAAWTRVAASLTDAAGRVAFAYTPAQRTVLRLQFLPPPTQLPPATYVPAESAVLTVAPKVRLSVPVLPEIVTRGSAVTVTGSVTPRHAPGAGAVRLELQRLTLEGTWATARTVQVVLSDAAAGSVYSRVVKLGSSGAWRLRATHPGDAAHAATAGGWRTFAVR